MLFRQLYDAVSSTYTYLLAAEDSREAIIIDPVFEQMHRDLALLRELDLTLKIVADTHAHADHVTAAWILKQKTWYRHLVCGKNPRGFVRIIWTFPEWLVRIGDVDREAERFLCRLGPRDARGGGGAV